MKTSFMISLAPVPLIWTARVRLMSAALLTALLLTSCGDGRVGVYPVSGRVMVAGQPAEQALVIFHPVDASGELEQIKPEGRTDIDGYFRLRTYGMADGAPAAEYRVAITWPAADPDMALHPDDPEHVAAGPDRLAGRYADPATSNLQVTVPTDNNELPPFVLD